MDPPNPDGHDSSSIKPVSSLLSHFENLTGAGKEVKPREPRETAVPTSLNRFKTAAEDDPSRKSSDSSHDGSWTPRGKAEDLQDGQRAPVPAPTLPPSETPTLPARPKPNPTGPKPPTLSPPALLIEAPRSPAKPAGVKPATLQPSIRPGVGPQADPLSGTIPPFSQIKLPPQVPRRPETPPVHRPRSPFLSAFEIDDLALQSTSSSSSGPERATVRGKLSATPPPPPVSRATKPISAQSSPGPSTVKDLLPMPSLAPVNMPSEDKISPFNTPPSSDEGSSPTPQSELCAIVPTPPSASSHRSTFDPPPVHHAVAEKRRDNHARTPSDLIRSVQSSGRSRGPPSSTLRDASDDRPGLPPRRPTEPATNASASAKIESTSRSASARFPAPSSRASTPTFQMTHQTYAPPPRRTGTSETAADADGRPKPKPRALDQPKIDRALDLPPIRSISSTLSRTTSEPSNDTLSDAGIAPYHATDYPDSSRANRRRPCFRVGVQEIHAKHDTRLFCISGDYVCSAGHFSRAWDLRTGEQVMSLSHGDFAKVTSLAFKPALNLDDEGTALWLGTNDGDLLEVDILSQSVVFTKNGAHHHSEVIRIFRHAREMWTLDDEGRLHMWPPDESGTPNLRYSPHPFRVPKGHSFSILVRGQLWLATGKEIRIFQPGLNVDNQFQVLARPLCQPAAGDVTSGATLGTKVDQVLFGHTDGKVTIYSPEDYSCVGIVNVSLYRISALTGVGSYLWAGYNTGMIYVYDTSTTPWTVKKDWQAHNDPVVNIMIDPSSMWKLDRLQVGSLGADNFMRVWDGMLQDDWLESEMQENDVEYCQFREAQVLVMTWNAGASKPGTFKRDDVDNAFFQHLLQESEAPEILVFGFQELIDLEDKRLTAKSFFKGSKKADSSDQEHMSRAYREWRDFLSRCVEDFMPTHERYDLLHTSSMVGLFTCIFVKESERERIGNVSNSEVKCGMGGLHGNKGALIVRFTFDDSSLCFVNCHLAAGQTQTVHRNNDIAAIIEAASLPPERDPAVRVERYIGGGDGSMILDHEICILNGDLNYRIDTMSRDTVVNAVKANNLTKLLERDQLLLSRRKNPGFRLRAFKESPITFAPTYKYDVGMDRYDTSEKRRSPAWCDRVLYRGLGRIKPVDYRRLELRVSDHRPVVASFKVRIKTVSPAQRTVIWGRCQERFMVFKQRVAQEAHLDFLVRVCGFDVTEAKTLAKSLMKSRRG